MGIFSSIAGSLTGSTAAKQSRAAGKQQERAIMRGLQVQQQQVAPALQELGTYSDLASTYLEPYRKMGWRGAAGVLDDEFEMPTAEEVAASPATQFRMEQAQRAIEMGAAARGGLFSGGHQRELARHMQGLASQEYDLEAQRRLQEAELAQRGQLGIAGLGLQAAGQTAGIRERLGQARSGIRTGSGAAAAAALQAGGQARASGALAGAQARQQGMGQLMKLGGQLGAAYLTGGTSLMAPGGMPGKGA